MADLLVKLYRIPELAPVLARAGESGVEIRRPLAPERYAVVNWVAQHYGDRWGSEVAMAFSGHPITCFIAVTGGGDIIGFSCYNATFKGFFGPTGVLENWGGRGIGTALLIRGLHALKDDGHAYAIIGGVGPSEFYEQVVGAIPVPDSSPGPYEGMIPA
ncbi:MAG: GNAT family N-acetyltransferase [Verrucomicrobiae bacterium]|nr:GNAT family N-acetyltransferase [Verrucomicrobiae bacterium]MCB1093326.1 GNAT family N-acetyltransferase [Verrucomicrobiae bacterium]